MVAKRTRRQIGNFGGGVIAMNTGRHKLSTGGKSNVPHYTFLEACVENAPASARFVARNSPPASCSRTCGTLFAMTETKYL